MLLTNAQSPARQIRGNRPPSADELRAQARAELERIARELGADLFLPE
jgi:hypothetical protein